MNKYMNIAKGVVAILLIGCGIIIFQNRFFSEKVGVLLPENKDTVVIQPQRRNNTPVRLLKSQSQGNSTPSKSSTSTCIQLEGACSESTASNCCPGSNCYNGKCVCTSSSCQSNSDCCKYNSCQNGKCTGGR